LPDGTVSHGELAARAQCHDLAVLRLRPKPTELTAVPLADSSGAAIGQSVKTVAYQPPEDIERRPPPLSQVPGRIYGINVSATFTPLPATLPFIAHQTSLQPAASGSPLLDAQGRWIGLNTFVGHPRVPPEPGIEYALTSDYVPHRLRQLSPARVGRSAAGRPNTTPATPPCSSSSGRATWASTSEGRGRVATPRVRCARCAPGRTMSPTPTDAATVHRTGDPQ
jgi:S1-C subfamily serine protease